MEKSTNLSFHLILLFSLQLKLADEIHQFVPVEVGILGKPGGLSGWF
jgi:hypothetical protein